MRRPGSGRPTCGSPPPRSSDVLGVSATGPTGVAADEEPSPAPATPEQVAGLPRSVPAAAERDAWAVLAGVRGLGPVGFGALLRRYGSAIAILREAASAGGPARLAEAAATSRGAAPRDDRVSEVVATGIAAAIQSADATLGRIRELGLTIVTLDDPTFPMRLARDRHAAARALRAGRSGGPQHRCRGRDRRDAPSDRPRTSRRRAPGHEPRGGRGMRRVGARGRHRWCGPRRGAPCGRHDRRGDRVGPRDHPSPRPSASWRTGSSPRVGRSCRSSVRTSCRARARSRVATGSSAGWPMPRSWSRHRLAAARSSPRRGRSSRAATATWSRDRSTHPPRPGAWPSSASSATPPGSWPGSRN